MRSCLAAGASTTRNSSRREPESVLPRTLGRSPEETRGPYWRALMRVPGSEWYFDCNKPRAMRESFSGSAV